MRFNLGKPVYVGIVVLLLGFVGFFVLLGPHIECDAGCKASFMVRDASPVLDRIASAASETKSIVNSGAGVSFGKDTSGYLSFSHISTNGTVIVSNKEDGIVIVFDLVIRDGKPLWVCTAYPSNMAPLTCRNKPTS
jgi:hypothetical protein